MDKPEKIQEFTNLLLTGLGKSEIMLYMRLEDKDYVRLLDKSLYKKPELLSLDYRLKTSKQWDLMAFIYGKRLSLISCIKEKLFKRAKEIDFKEGYRTERINIRQKVKRLNNYESYYYKKFNSLKHGVKFSDPFYQH